MDKETTNFLNPSEAGKRYRPFWSDGETGNRGSDMSGGEWTLSGNWQEGRRDVAGRRKGKNKKEKPKSYGTHITLLVNKMECCINDVNDNSLLPPLVKQFFIALFIHFPLVFFVKDAGKNGYANNGQQQYKCI